SAARLVDRPASAFAAWTGLRDAEDASRRNDLPAAIARRARLIMRALLRARSTARFARVELRDGDFLFATVRRLVTSDFQIVAQIRAAQCTAGIAAPSSAEQIVEDAAACAAARLIKHLAKDIERIVKITEAAAATRRTP